MVTGSTWSGRVQNKFPDMIRGSEHKVQAQNNTPFVIVICRESNFPFYTKECHWIHLSDLRLWPMPICAWATQNALHFLFILCDFSGYFLPLHLGKQFLAFVLFFSFNMCVCWFSLFVALLVAVHPVFLFFSKETWKHKGGSMRW